MSTPATNPTATVGDVTRIGRHRVIGGDVAGESSRPSVVAAQPSTGAPPVVSVIITCCNGARWIVNAVDSALAQSYPWLEIIVLDDASSDGSPEILRRYSGHEHVQLVFQQRTRGIPATKNAGTARCNGRYIAFLEQDDVWFEKKLARQVALLEADASLGMVFVEPLVAGPDGEQYQRKRRPAIPVSTKELIKTFFQCNPVVSMSSVVIRRDVLAELGGFDESYAGGDDYELFLRLVGRYRVTRIDEPLLRYGWNHGSFSWTAMDRILQDHLLTVEKAVALYPFLGPLRRRRVAQLWLSSAIRSYEAGATARAFAWAWQALRVAPSFIRAIPAFGLMSTGELGRWALHRRRWTVLFKRVP